jgi:Fic family protein
MTTDQVAFSASYLPLDRSLFETEVFFNALIDATAQFEVYKEKIADSKLDKSWFLPTLQQKEALASSVMEGTQATLDGIFVDEVYPNERDLDVIEVRNYNRATRAGYRHLRRDKMSKDFILELHQILMSGNVRNQSNEIGVFRSRQNYIGKLDGNHEITYTPPLYEDVPKLIDNLVDYMLNSKDAFRPLVRTAIIHAQFETIHPFMDGNGRVGRILIPLYLYAVEQIDMPCFFVSEALEKDKMKYYTLLNNIRTKGAWSEWIKFFLDTVTLQCKKYIKIISAINKLYDVHLEIACSLVRSNHMTAIVNLIYKYPIINAATIAKETEIPSATINRYLNALVEAQILFTDGKRRNRTYFYYDLLDIIRD